MLSHNLITSNTPQRATTPQNLASAAWRVQTESLEEGLAPRQTALPGLQRQSLAGVGGGRLREGALPDDKSPQTIAAAWVIVGWSSMWIIVGAIPAPMLKQPGIQNSLPESLPKLRSLSGMTLRVPPRTLCESQAPHSLGSLLRPCNTAWRCWNRCRDTRGVDAVSGGLGCWVKFSPRGST